MHQPCPKARAKASSGTARASVSGTGEVAVLWEYSALGSAGGQQRLDARAADVPNGLDGGATAPMGPATSAPEPGAPSGRAGGEKGLGIERELRVEGLSAYWDTGVRACVSVQASVSVFACMCACARAPAARFVSVFARG